MSKKRRGTTVAFPTPRIIIRLYDDLIGKQLNGLACVCVCVQCYMFHMYVGVRAGGGIGDEIEDPAGDESEFYRVVFDITFFFFVIVILLAIIQGENREPSPQPVLDPAYTANVTLQHTLSVYFFLL